MKAVLISIHPKWCELIASGKKTVEVRKTKPKLETPFKCYIYCTHNNRKYALHTYINSGYGRKNFGVIGNWLSGKDVVDANSHLPGYRYNAYLAEGKVIGEFVCDNIAKGTLQLGSCLSLKQISEYANGKDVYGWHISDLVIYDKPKELSEFKQCHKCEYYANCFEHELSCDGIYNLKRPPQSWCYVEEVRQ